MGDWFAAAQTQYDNELPPYLDHEDDNDDDNEDEDES